MFYGFAKQAGGHIRIYSEVGQGTTVKLYLPRASGTEDIEPEADLEAVSDLPVGDETILLVEDDRDVAVFATAALETLGYRVVAASNGRSEEHTSELQSLMRNSYAVFCLKKT